MTDHDRMWLLVTGTGRCGTGFLAQVLNSCDVRCTHEKVFRLDGIEFAREQVKLRELYPEWGWQADSSWLAMPFLDDPCIEGMTIVHLVRHPRNVIRSLARIENWTKPRYARGQAFLYEHMPELLDWPVGNERSAAFWCRWNERIEPHAHFTHRVEDNVCHLLDQLDISYANGKLYDNDHYNTRAFVPEDDFELDDLPNELKRWVSAMMERYGYEWGGHQPTRYELREKGLIG